MNPTIPLWTALCLVGGLTIAACEHRQPDDPSTQYGQPTGYDQYGNPTYGQPQPGYAPAPAAQPQAYQPQSSFALPCRDDITCGTHRCNLQTGLCAFPCTAPTDCAAGMGCMNGLCVPGVATPVQPQQ
jgi:hypothetical protein